MQNVNAEHVNGCGIICLSQISSNLPGKKYVLLLILIVVICTGIGACHKFEVNTGSQ